MKKTQEIRLVSNGDDLDAVLDEAAKFSESMNLAAKDSLRVMLLTEETMGMIKTLTGEMELILSFIGQEDECIIRVETDTMMNIVKKENILAVSSTGKNALAKGIMGKVRDAFETASMMSGGSDLSAYGSPLMVTGMPMNVYPDRLMDRVYWTLDGYKKSVEDEEDSPEHKERWDELEKSIVSNIADDVQVGVRNGHVVMTIIYKCKNV